MTTSPDGLWKAVAERDVHADGLFVYAVKSTGIYCRPSCASRKPRRDRVDFFPAPAMAEAGGYRPCRRCKPNVERGGPPALERVRRACEAVASRPDLPWTSQRLARAGGTSTVQLQRAFRDVLGLGPREYVAACRRRRFLDTLRNGRSVTAAIYEAGYGSPSRVYESIRLPGMTPATYGRGGRGATIHWAAADSTIGRLMVAATDRGLCFVEVGATDRELLRHLREEYPNAVIDARPSGSLAPMIDAARGVAEARPVPADVPVDIIGTAFQWRVWRALTEIPPGQTQSYSEIARVIGRPKAIRAVGRACATNPLALVVPCHRVVRTDGNLGGYRWGLDVKRALLQKERERKAR
jgi:AraC family transcriptional regulator of adaptative response/methylated-DNA-[protein]-cysteine methyltransferase